MDNLKLAIEVYYKSTNISMAADMDYQTAISQAMWFKDAQA